MDDNDNVLNHEENNGKDENGKWIKGYCPNPSGRPKGLRNKADAIKRAFFQTFQDRFGDADNDQSRVMLLKFAQDKPEAFLKIVAYLLPKEIQIDGDVIKVRQINIVIPDARRAEHERSTITAN